MKELTVGMTIKFDNGSDECFVIDKIFPGNIVDMTATKSRIEWMPDLREKFYSIPLVNFEIVECTCDVGWEGETPFIINQCDYCKSKI